MKTPTNSLVGYLGWLGTSVSQPTPPPRRVGRLLSRDEMRRRLEHAADTVENVMRSRGHRGRILGGNVLQGLNTPRTIRFDINIYFPTQHHHIRRLLNILGPELNAATITSGIYDEQNVYIEFTEAIND